jgi:hypothetical protein
VEQIDRGNSETDSGPADPAVGQPARYSSLATALGLEKAGRSPLSPAQWTEVKFGWSRCTFVNAQFAIAPVFQQFNASDGGTEPGFELTPASGLIERVAHAPDGIAQETNRGHAGQQLALTIK